MAERTSSPQLKTETRSIGKYSSVLSSEVPFKFLFNLGLTNFFFIQFVHKGSLIYNNFRSYASLEENYEEPNSIAATQANQETSNTIYVGF